ncbi:hypothetical protein Sango_0585900 [Sesamum angolense]|uniref:MULE transposase domain-containing protein n=1 Tax=Sesamum angolense TaxID=2727404 RepID=A0AAE1X6T6_9LAMI|nr:hypothetical protein Sango_0585900 [Sesamum angolense]
MLIATAMDGNQQVPPLAFAIVDEETYPSWKWFLQQLSRHVIRGRRGICLISDRHGGIIKAVREGPDFVSPHGVHRYCLRHGQNGHGINTHVVKNCQPRMLMRQVESILQSLVSHAQKVCGAYNISAASMVKDYYDLMAYNNTYSKHFEPVQSEDYWDDPNFQLVHDPTIRISTRPGRNQTTRIHNEMEIGATRARPRNPPGDSSIQENLQ